MASDLRIRVGTATATIQLNGPSGNITDAQVANALRRYAGSVGLPLEGTAVEQLTAILLYWRDEVRDVAMAVHRRELHAAQDATIEATVTSENEI